MEENIKKEDFNMVTDNEEFPNLLKERKALIMELVKSQEEMIDTLANSLENEKKCLKKNKTHLEGIEAMLVLVDYKAHKKATKGTCPKECKECQKFRDLVFSDNRPSFIKVEKMKEGTNNE